MKAGSKRRRTKASMAEQLERESIVEMDKEAKDAASTAKDELIEKLQFELSSARDEAKEGKFATNWVQSEIDAGRISVDGAGQPSIIRNAGEGEEDSMGIDKR